MVVSCSVQVQCGGVMGTFVCNSIVRVEGKGLVVDGTNNATSDNTGACGTSLPAA